MKKQWHLLSNIRRCISLYIDIFNTDKKYQIIYADPPWQVTKSKRKVRPNQHGWDYPTMSVEEIKNLPITHLSDNNCVLFLWTTQKYLPFAFDVIESWGFKYQRVITWDKQNGMCLFGFHNRTEFLLFGYKGKIEPFPKRNAIPTIFQISSKKLKHSQKPDEIQNAISVMGDKRIELFARRQLEGWDCWGNEVGEER